MDAVVVENLVKRYGDVVALDGVSFSVARGEVFGLLGAQRGGEDHDHKDPHRPD